MTGEFLRRGHRVAVCGRSAQSIDKAVVAGLAAEHDRERMIGQPCDVSDHGQVQELWDAATARFGRVDVWINNAGLGAPAMNFGNCRRSASKMWSAPNWLPKPKITWRFATAPFNKRDLFMEARKA
jgi:NAD(P)-dependent dehydrogenase (short-subunit alcohol dehydrogenase family)